MSQSHATDEFHSRHLSTMVTDSVEQYMGHFQHNQTLLLERLASLEQKISHQPTAPPTSGYSPPTDQKEEAQLEEVPLVTSSG